MDLALMNINDFEAKALEVANLLRALGNQRRLMILCRLLEEGESNVTALADSIGISQSALSQHLAKMRKEGIIAFHRESQSIWYRIADPRIEKIMSEICRLYCAP